MTEITAAMVKELRERTGAAMMDCKKALVEAKGNMNEAEEVIAKSGHRKAAKSASRIAAEGRISIATSTTDAVILEVNCETDFVGRDANFSQFCQTITDCALKNPVKELNTLLTLPFEGSLTIEDARKNLIARIGENIQIRRMHKLQAENNQRFGAYVHMTRIGVLVLLEGGNEVLAKDLAMHIAAMKPQFIAINNIPSAIVEKEKTILLDLAKQSGKPANIIEKIVDGQLNKHFCEICLEGQPFFKDQDKTIAALLKENQAKVLEMVRFEVGEGIEVIKKSFEEEVMSQARGSQS